MLTDPQFIDRLKELILPEIGTLPEGDGLKNLVQRGEMVSLPPRAVIVRKGDICRDLMIVVEGILRSWDINEGRERTYAFALPGTIFTFRYPFVRNLPSPHFTGTCTPAKFIRIAYDDFWDVLRHDVNLSMWFLRYAHVELFFQEHKFFNVNKGSAKERLESIYHDRPEIIRSVPQRIVASYLGITPEYFSALKRALLKG